MQLSREEETKRQPPDLAMAPLPSRVLRPRGGDGIVKTTTKGKGIGKQQVTKAMVPTKKGTKKRTTTSNTGVKRKRAKKNVPVHQGGDSDEGSDIGSDDGSDVDDVPARDTMTVIGEALSTAEGGSCWRNYDGHEEMFKIYSRGRLREEAWNDLIDLDPSIGHLHPKDVVSKLVTGQINEQIREKIAAYVRLTLRDVKRSLLHLLVVPNWDDQVAGVIVDIIQKYVREHLGVEVTELGKLAELANELKAESKQWQVVKGDALKNSVRDWACNTGDLDATVKKWAKEPKCTFSSCDEKYKDNYDRSRFVSLCHVDP